MKVKAPISLALIPIRTTLLLICRLHCIGLLVVWMTVHASTSIRAQPGQEGLANLASRIFVVALISTGFGVTIGTSFSSTCETVCALWNYLLRFASPTLLPCARGDCERISAASAYCVGVRLLHGANGVVVSIHATELRRLLSLLPVPTSLLVPPTNRKAALTASFSFDANAVVLSRASTSDPRLPSRLALPHFSSSTLTYWVKLCFVSLYFSCFSLQYLFSMKVKPVSCN